MVDVLSIEVRKDVETHTARPLAFALGTKFPGATVIDERSLQIFWLNITPRRKVSLHFLGHWSIGLVLSTQLFFVLGLVLLILGTIPHMMVATTTKAFSFTSIQSF